MQSVTLNYEEECRRDFELEFPLAQEASRVVIEATRGGDFSSLARRSPALKGFNWDGYLRLSALRMVRALRLLSERVGRGSRVLDFGAYFGNFSVMLADAGYRVTALDSYSDYGDCLRPVVDLMERRGVEVVEALPRADNSAADGFDAVVFMGVIEHVPHTPRFLLQEIWHSIKPGGLLVLDTPNLGYIYNRQRLARGESIFPPIQTQYWTEIPFEGHHREYTKAEIEWMLSAAGFAVDSFDSFNYSIYGLTELAGLDLENYRAMLADPSMRELLMFSASRPFS